MGMGMTGVCAVRGGGRGRSWLQCESELIGANIGTGGRNDPPHLSQLVEHHRLKAVVLDCENVYPRAVRVSGNHVSYDDTASWSCCSVWNEVGLIRLQYWDCGHRL